MRSYYHLQDHHQYNRYYNVYHSTVENSKTKKLSQTTTKLFALHERQWQLNNNLAYNIRTKQLNPTCFKCDIRFISLLQFKYLIYINYYLLLYLQ